MENVEIEVDVVCIVDDGWVVFFDGNNEVVFKVESDFREIVQQLVVVFEVWIVFCEGILIGVICILEINWNVENYYIIVEVIVLDGVFVL